MQLGFVVVGLGAIAKMHLDAICALPQARLVAVVSRREERAREVAAQYRCEAFTDYRPLLDRKDVHVITIITPSGARRDITLDGAKAGKHILVEKPVEVTLERIDEMITACDQAGVTFGGIFQFRFKPAWQFLKEAVSTGLLGKIYVGDAYNKWYRSEEYYASAGWRGTWELDGGGALMNQGIHIIDLLQWIMGDPVEIFAYTRTLRHHIEVEDTAVAVLKYKSGAVGVIEGTTSIYPGFPMTMEIHGEKGSVQMADDCISHWSVLDTPRGIKEKVQDLSQQVSQSVSSDPTQRDSTWHRLQIDDFIQAILHGREPQVSGREGRKSVRIIQSIYQSAQEGRPIKLV